MNFISIKILKNNKMIIMDYNSFSIDYENMSSSFNQNLDTVSS
jgi:hypothetical protein